MTRFLVTGGAGFVGTHVVQRLEVLGHHVAVVDSFEPRVHGPGHEGRRVADIGYTDLIEADVVIHLAAQVGVADSMTDPLRYVLQNTVETATLLEEMAAVQKNRPTHFQRLIVASSMSVYGDPRQAAPVSETHACVPASVYGLTKYDQERLCLLYGQMLGIPTVALRFFNVYGPGQALTNPYTGVLANFAAALLRDEAPMVFEDGQQTRDFVYVTDVADAVVLAATQAQSSAVYNVCTGVATPIAQIALSLARALGKPIAPTITHTTRPGDIRHCIGDPVKLFADYGWTADVTFADGIQRYAEALCKSTA